ncbi:N2227-domain-containing protein [Pisolithus croceorrhizus]|nr:N2227-domain-containing protein [Pisolithus croceorrhizus]KAI6130606.1 N2227-domain-containing protein [Pisolithus croceorrhizus]KAI6161790.1 N2227-domain-containing protein [Pisolithus thermaeus]
MCPQFSEDDVEEEQAHFQHVVSTFQQYARYSLNANNRRRKDIHTIPLADRELLTKLGYGQKLKDVDKAILANAAFLNKIVESPEIFGHAIDADTSEAGNGAPGPRAEETAYEHAHPHTHAHSHDRPTRPSDPRKGRYRPTEFDMDKLRSTIKLFVRDWSRDGKTERDLCYEPMKKALEEHFEGKDRSTLRVLVPGAGLGRLAYDVARLGFACQGNEFSHYMLLASYLILNRTQSIDEHTIYPYIHSFSNVLSRETLLKAVTIPDVLPSDLPPGSNFSLVAGDFEEIYGAEDTDENEPQAGKWDAILTCFFIDTAKNIVNYLRVLHRILAPGGVWINLGPLLWHFENNEHEYPSIELDLSEVKELARMIGFKLYDERTIDTSYSSNDQSMLGYVYHAAFWKAVKVSPAE